MISSALFLNIIIMFKYCTMMKKPFSHCHLAIVQRAYPQSYPQILWVSHFLFFSNDLCAKFKAKSSIHCQAIDGT